MSAPLAIRCSSCKADSPFKEGDRFCRLCGAKLQFLQAVPVEEAPRPPDVAPPSPPPPSPRSVPPSIEAAPSAPPRSAPPPVEAAPSAPPPSRKTRTGSRALGVISILAVLVGGGWAYLHFFADPGKEEPARPAYVWNVPENPYESFSSEPLVLTPMKGVLVSAPGGALDRPREIGFRRVTGRRARASAERLDRDGWVMEAALEFDAGMRATDRFRRPVKVIVDLDELGVDPRLWPYAGLMVEEDDGALVLQSSRTDGQLLEWSTTHNGPVFIVVGLSTIFGLTKYGLVDPDREAETEGREWYGFHSDSERFNILWPVDRHANAGEAADAFGRLEKLWDEYREARRTQRLPPPPAPGVPSPYRSFEDYLRQLHQVIENLEAIVGDREWQKRHWAHPAAVVVADALDFAHAYLAGRGFNPPSHVVNVYLRDPWTHGSSVLGLAENRMTRAPYISLQLGGVPVRSRGDRLTGEAGVSLEVTLVHELFHVFQTGYGPGEYLDRNPFWIAEAAALTLEGELWGPPYQARFGTEAWYRRALTDRNPYWYAYRSPMEPSGITGLHAITFSDGLSLQHHGYGYSYFFEYLKQETAAVWKDTFLTAFYNAMNQTGSAAGALQRLSRAGSGKDLAEHYATFVFAHANDIAAQPSPNEREKVEVTPSERRFAWGWHDAPPLSSQIYRVLIADTVPGYDQAVTVLETEARPDTVKMRFRGLASMNWTDVSDALTLVPRATPRRRGGTHRDGMLLQVVGAYSPMDNPPGPGGWWLTLLLPPALGPELPQGPTLDLERILEGEEKELRVRWQRSPLSGDPGYRSAFPLAFRGQSTRDMIRSSAHAQKMGHEGFRYELELETWVRGRRVGEAQVQVERERTDTTIPWEKVLPPKPEDRIEPFEIRVRMREALLVGTSHIKGEPGPFSVLKIEPMRCEETLFRVSVTPDGSGGRAKSFTFFLMPEAEVISRSQARKSSPLTARERENVLNTTFESSMRDAADRRAIQAAMPAQCFELLSARRLFIMWHGVYTLYKPSGEIDFQAEYERGFSVRTIVREEPEPFQGGTNPFGGQPVGGFGR